MAVVIATAYVAVGRAYARLWTSPFTLWRYTVMLSPLNERAQVNYYKASLAEHP